MSLWWMQPGWGDATCGTCGRNIQESGGDPDWGLCFEHMAERVQSEEQAYPEPYPPCDICGENEACAGVNGLGVCSQECANEAARRHATEQERDDA